MFGHNKALVIPCVAISSFQIIKKIRENRVYSVKNLFKLDKLGENLLNIPMAYYPGEIRDFVSYMVR